MAITESNFHLKDPQITEEVFHDEWFRELTRQAESGNIAAKLQLDHFDERGYRRRRVDPVSGASIYD